MFQKIKRWHKNRQISGMMAAVESGDIGRVQKALKIEPSLANCVNDEMVTPLHKAAFHGHLEICEMLLQHGADPNAKSNDTFHGAFPLEWCYIDLHKYVAYDTYMPADEGAFTENSTKIIELLLNRGANANQILPRACQRLDNSMIKLLLENGADANLQPAFQEGYAFESCPFLICINNRQDYTYKDSLKKALNILLEYGADINATDQYGNTALHELVSSVAWCPDPELVEFLVKKGADTRIKNEENETAHEKANTRIAVLKHCKEGKNGRIMKEEFEDRYSAEYNSLEQIVEFFSGHG